MPCLDCRLLQAAGYPVPCGNCHYAALRAEQPFQPQPLPSVERDRESQARHLHTDTCPPRPSVMRVNPTTFRIVSDGAVDFVGFCPVHHTVTSGDVSSLRDVQPCRLCAEEVTARRGRERYLELSLLERVGSVGRHG